MLTGFITFTVVGGIMRTAGDMLTNSFVWMHDTLGIVGGMVLGFLYSPLTMTGMHHSLLPVDIQMVAAGGSFLLAIASCNNVAQGGATLCAMLRTKDKKLKSVAATSGVSAMLGITEPAMFGVNLKLKYPFYGAMIGAALGGGYVTLTNVLNTAPGTAGIVGFVCVPAASMLNFLIPMQKMPTAIMARSYGRIWIKARLWNVSVNIMVRTWQIRLPLATV